MQKISGGLLLSTKKKKSITVEIYLQRWILFT